MSTPISTLIAGIETQAGSFLTGFTKLSYGIDVASNRSGGSAKSFAVLPLGASQEDSIGALVVNQEFSIKLTDSYLPGKLKDHNSQVITNTLYDNVYGFYEHLVNTKCGAPSLVMNTFGLSVGVPEYTKEEVVIIEMKFTIKHRT